MKKIFIPILILLAGFAFTGCDDLLDAVPKDRLSGDTFFKSESELQAYAIGFYELFPSSDLYVANDDHFTQSATARTSRSASSTRLSPVSSAPISISPRSSASATSRGMTSPWAPRIPNCSTSLETAAN